MTNLILSADEITKELQRLINDLEDVSSDGEKITVQGVQRIAGANADECNWTVSWFRGDVNPYKEQIVGLVKELQKRVRLK